MRGVFVALAIALGGCTAILDLNRVSSVDRDNDNVPDAIDNCPDDANPDQSDFDNNGKGDACDLCTGGGAEDVDGDGIPDGCDGCIGNGADADMDGIDDGCDACLGNGMDVDHDGIDDGCDDCVANGLDADHDGTDDGCDACVVQPAHVDDDGDGLENFCDPCPLGPQHDEDGDLVYDACDVCKANRDMQQNDGDGDGVGNQCDPDETAVDYERMDPFTVLDPAWFAEGAPWTIANDTVRLSSNTSSYRWLGALRGDLTLTTRMRFDAVPVFIGTPSVGLIAFDSTSSLAARQISCAVNMGGSVLATLTVNDVISAYDFSSASVTPSAYFDLTLEVDDSKKLITCKASNDSVDATAMFSYNELGVLWFAGLKVEYADATFKYFDQVGRLP